MKISKEDIKCARKLSGNLDTDQERSMFEISLMLEDSLREKHEDYKRIWDCYPSPSLPLQKEKNAKRIFKGVSAEKEKPNFLKDSYKLLLPIAAVLLVGLFLYMGYPSSDSRYTNHIITAEGERTQVNLPDGSQVTVNSGSELKYPETFSEEDREVWISGEAYFDIKKDEGRPFRVNSDGFTVQVLGTKFNINERGDKKAVSLESGEVQVTLKDSGDRIRLDPKEELVWNIATGEVVKRNFDVSKTTAWKDNILLLDNLTLREALGPINQFYGTEFVIADSLTANKKISGAFEDQDLDRFIETMEFIADVKIIPLSPREFSITPNHED